MLSASISATDHVDEFSPPSSLFLCRGRAFQLRESGFEIFGFNPFCCLIDDDFRGPNPGGWWGALFHHHLAERRHGSA